MRKRSVMAVAALAVTGCVPHYAGVQTQALDRVEYRGDTALKLHAPMPRQLTLLVVDQRAAVTSGEKPASFVGTRRIKWGIPKDLSTNSGHSLARDFSYRLANRLGAQGARVEQRVVPAGTDPEFARQAATPGQLGARGLLFTLNEWNTDGVVSPTLQWDVRLEVLSASGRILASAEVRGEKTLGDKDGQTTLEQKIGVIYSSLLNAPGIAAALTGPEAPASL